MFKSIITSALSVLLLVAGITGAILSLDIAPLPGDSHTFWDVLLFATVFVFSLVTICFSIPLLSRKVWDTWELIVNKGR